MMSRRRFLTTTPALGVASTASVSALGMPPAGDQPAATTPLAGYESILAATDRLDLFGRPRDWSRVRQGFHPISPERVIIVREKGGDGWLGRDRQCDDRLRGRLDRLGLSAGKLDLILRLMHVVTDHYHVPHLYEPWATRLARREALGSTGMGNGFGLLHQFQDEGQVTLANAPVDWWAILAPDGIEWDALDGEPVYGMIGHIFPPHHRQLPGLTLRVWEMTSRVAREVMDERVDPAAWQRLARLGRVRAAREVNLAAARCL